MKVSHITNESGMAVLIALIMVGVLALLGIAALNTSNDEVSIAGNQLHEAQCFYAAESGLEKASAIMLDEYEKTNRPPVSLPIGSDLLNGSTVSYTTADNGPAEQRQLTTGSAAGLHALVKTFAVSSTAVDPNENARVTLTAEFETDLIPIYQFAVFYQNDLEISPGPDMELTGRVHTNGDLYLQSDKELRLNSFTTSAGSVYHGRKGPGGIGTGDVFIKNGVGLYTNMKAGSGWLDHNSSDWYDSSIARWNGKVMDKAHGQPALNLPLNGGTDPRQLIAPASSNPDSYENQATLKFVNNRALKKVGGLWTDVTADMAAKGIITMTPDQFTDQRENKKVDCTDLDVAKLYANGYAPANGIIYFSDDNVSSTSFPALRLKDGAELGDGLTVASNNPIYTVGDFNSKNKKPASLMADAVTFLSSSWSDGSSASSKSTRVAVATTVNACYMTGNVETTNANFSGGFENLPRFLETWSGTDFTWSGSAVCLWNSIQATGTWNGNYYDPPNRRWSYDQDLNDPSKLPPGTPVIRLFQRNGWQEQYVGDI